MRDNDQQWHDEPFVHYTNTLTYLLTNSQMILHCFLIITLLLSTQKGGFNLSSDTICNHINGRLTKTKYDIISSNYTAAMLKYVNKLTQINQPAGIRKRKMMLNISRDRAQWSNWLVGWSLVSLFSTNTAISEMTVIQLKCSGIFNKNIITYSLPNFMLTQHFWLIYI